jgi:restriction system protein
VSERRSAVRRMSEMPTMEALVWPTLRAICSAGGSATLQEIAELVVQQENISEAIQGVPHGDSPRTELEYRLAWARTYLKNIAAVEKSARGVWRATDLGRFLDESGTTRLLKEWRAGKGSKVTNQTDDQDNEEAAERRGPAEDEDFDWSATLLERLLGVPPDAFERLARLLLREAGFVNVSVTGKSGDGGIDGLGVYRLSLVSFPVFFQCKRYRGSVGSAAVRDFRGAMQGRGDKGLLITTGTVTSEAKAEATRDGAPPIDLVDGARLCELLKEQRLGVLVHERVVEDVTLDERFFEELRSACHQDVPQCA